MGRLAPSLSRPVMGTAGKSKPLRRSSRRPIRDFTLSGRALNGVEIRVLGPSMALRRGFPAQQQPSGVSNTTGMPGASWTRLRARSNSMSVRRRQRSQMKPNPFFRAMGTPAPGPWWEGGPRGSRPRRLPGRIRGRGPALHPWNPGFPGPSSDLRRKWRLPPDPAPRSSCSGNGRAARPA